MGTFRVSKFFTLPEATKAKRKGSGSISGKPENKISAGQWQNLVSQARPLILPRRGGPAR
jgi:hypothetical protein